MAGMKPSGSLLLALVAAIVAACATGPGAGDAAPRSVRQSNVITAEDIQRAARSQHAYDLIRELRPQWLRSRGVQSLGGPTGSGAPSPVAPREREPTGAMVFSAAVYVNGARAGTSEILRQILARDLQEARYLNATEASARFGTDHHGGAIMLTLRER
jgi:hypothetical protein